MKKTLTFLITLAILFLGLSGTGQCRSEKSLYNMFHKKKLVKVYVSDITNLSGNNNVDVADLKSRLINVFRNRRSINFKVVTKKDRADIVVDCDVTAYYWASEEMLLGVRFGKYPIHKLYYILHLGQIYKLFGGQL